MKLAAALFLLALAACDGGGEPRQVKKITVTDSGASLQRLRALTDQDRDLTLRRAVQDAGQSCPRVLNSAEIGTYENMAMFTARCEGDRNWAIFIAPAGAIQVRSCEHVAELGLPTCETGKPAGPNQATRVKS